MRPKIVVTYQRAIFATTHELTLPDGWPLPRVGEQIVPPDGDENGDPPYKVITVEHVFAPMADDLQIIVVTRPDDWMDHRE